MPSQFLLLPSFIEIPVFNANRVDPDQMPHSAASGQGLHCLPMSLLWDARHKWVGQVSNHFDVDSQDLDQITCVSRLI